MWPNQKGKNAEENSSKVKGRQSGSGGKAKQTRTKMKAVQPPPETPAVADERTELEDQVSGVWKNRVMQPHKSGPTLGDPLLQKIQSKASNEVSERQKMANLQEAMIRMVDRMFDSFQNIAYDFNMRTGGSDLELNWVRPSIMRESSNAWHQKAAHIEVFTGRMSTRYWTLVIRGTFEGVLAYIIPADKLISFGLNPTEFKPYFDIKPEADDFDIVWKIDEKAISQELFPSIYRSLMDALISFAQDEGSIAEQFDLSEIGISTALDIKPKSKEEEEYARRYQAALQKAEDKAFLFSDQPEPKVVAPSAPAGWQDVGAAQQAAQSEQEDDGWLPIAPVGGNQAEWKNMGAATRTRMESAEQAAQKNDSQSSGQYAQMRIEPLQTLGQSPPHPSTVQTGTYQSPQISSPQSDQYQTGQHSLQSGQHSLQTGQHSQQTGDHSQQTGQHSLQTGQHSQQTGQHSQQSGQHSLQTGQHSQQSGQQQSQQSGQYGSQQSGQYPSQQYSSPAPSQQSGGYPSPSLESGTYPAPAMQSGQQPMPPGQYPPPGYQQHQGLRQSGQFSTRQGYVPFGTAPSGTREPTVSNSGLQSQPAPVQQPAPSQQPPYQPYQQPPYQQPRSSNSRLQSQSQKPGTSSNRLPTQGMAGRGIYQPAGYQHPSTSKADQVELLAPSDSAPNAVLDSSNSQDTGSQKPPMGLYDRLAESIGSGGSGSSGNPNASAGATKSSDSWGAPPPPPLSRGPSSSHQRTPALQPPAPEPVSQSPSVSSQNAHQQPLSLTDALRVLLPGLDQELESLARQGGEAFAKRDFKLADDILKWSGRLSQFREEAADLLHELDPEE